MLKKHKCKICKKIFKDYESNHRIFCSKLCASRNKSIKMKGRLANHLAKWVKKNGTWNKGIVGSMSREKNGHWKGGEYSNMGYVYSLMPEHPLARKNGYVLRARLVIEKCLGRFTTKKESPHHRNKIRSDDRIENLVLYKDKATHNRADKGHLIPNSDIIFDGLTYQKRKDK